MQGHPGILRIWRAVFNRRTLLFVVRATVLLSMSFAVAFGFLAAINSPAAAYDPHSFAIGVAGLFGAACGALGLLLARTRLLRQTLRDVRQRAEDLSDRNWELKEAEERAKSFLERKAT